MRRRTLLLAALLVAGGVAAAEGSSTSPLDPRQMLRRGVERLLEFLAEHPRAGARPVGGFLDKAIAPLFDFDSMAARIAGPDYRRWDRPRRTRFRDACKTHMIGSLAGAIAAAPPTRVRHTSAAGEPAAGHLTLGVEVRRRDGVVVPLDFHLQQRVQGWRITDVSAFGLSAVAYYRWQWQVLLLRHGHEGAVERLRAG